MIWDDVYAALEPFGVNVLGGRVSGIGVGGFLLGGGEFLRNESRASCLILLVYVPAGYSWMSNQFGLAIDNVVAFELVQPNGHIITVTNSSDPELFFGLKGGMNNFVSPHINRCSEILPTYLLLTNLTSARPLGNRH